MADIDPQKFPALAAFMASQQPATAPQPRNLISAALSAGTDEFQGNSAQLIGTLGTALGSQKIADFGNAIADSNMAEAQQNGRADLEGGIFDDGLAGAPKRAAYQFFKQVPNIGASLLASWALKRPIGGLLAEGGAAAQVGARVPAILGGGGLRAGAAEAAKKAALAEGKDFVAGTLGAAPVMYPQAVGSMWQEARASGQDTQANAFKALGLGVPYALMEGLEPGALKQFIAKGAEGNLAKRIATRALGVAPTEAVTEGVQTAMEQSFRPDLTLKEKATNIVDAAITGGIVGGMFGGVSGALGGRVRQLKSEDPKMVTDDSLKSTVDQALGLEPTGQYTMTGLDARQRPANSPAVTSGPVQTPDFTTGSQTTITNMPLKPQGEEFDRAVQGPFKAETTFTPPQAAGDLQGPAVEGRRVFPYNTPGTATWNRYEDVGGRSPQQIAAEREAQEGSATSDPTRQFNLFAADDAAMPTQTRPRAGEDISQRSEEEVKSITLTKSLIGEGRSQWQKALLETPAQDETDVLANAVTMLNSFDESGKAPQGLLTVLKNNGLLDSKGAVRDLQAELQDARAQADLLWQRAKETGEGVKQAQAFQKGTLAKIEKAAATQAAVQQRLAQRAAAPAPQTAAPETAPQIKSAAESAEVLASAPPVAPPPTFQQRFATRGVAPQPGSVAEAPEAAPEVVTASTPAPAAPVRDASGTQYQTLEQRMRSGAAPRISPDVTVAPSPQARVGAALGLTTPPEAATQYVTKQDKAKATRKRQPRSQVEAVAQRANAAAAAMAPSSALGGGTSFTAAPPVTPTPAADIEPGGPRDQIVRQLTRAKLERIANTDDVGRPMRQAASEAGAALDAMQPGADEMATRVLAEYSLLTGDTVFSTRPVTQRQPPMSEQAFDQELKKIAAKLPQSAREAIVIVNTAQELPPEVLAAAQASGMHPSEIRGVLHQGQVFVVADNVSSAADLQEVIDHELFGHGGARALLGDQRGPILTRVWDMVGGLEGLRSLARYFGVERQLNTYLLGRDLTDADKIALTDELVAQVAGKTSGKWRTFLMAWASRFKSALINTLDAIGLKTAAARLNTFTPVDMAEMIVRMREAVLRGGNINGRGGPAFSKEEQETLSWSPERLNAAIKDSDYSHIGSRQQDAKHYVAWVNPESFLMATATGDEAIRGVINKTSKTLYPDIAAVSANSQTPFLIIEDGRVVGHEGRHRMAALARKGVTSVPVIVDDRQGGKPREPVETMKLGPQGGSIGNVNLTNLIPLNEANRTRIEAAMGDGTSFLRLTPAGLDETTQKLSAMADQFKARLDRSNIRELSLKGNQLNLYTSSVGHIVRFYEKLFDIRDAAGKIIANGLRMLEGASNARVNTEQRLAHLVQRTLDAYDVLEKMTSKMTENVRKLMGYTIFNIDPRKTWDEQPWLHGLRNADVLKKHATEANGLYRTMAQIAGQNKGQVSAHGVYSDFINVNEAMHYAQQAVSLYNIMANDEGVLQSVKDELASKNPMQVFLDGGNKYDQPADARKYWFDATNAMVTRAKEYLDTQNNMSQQDPALRTQIAAAASAIQSRLNTINSEQQAMARAPYFHIGRFGDWVLRFDIKRNDKGVADPAAMERIAKVFEEAGIRDIEIPEVERANAYIRFEKVGERDVAHKIAMQLAAEGVISDVQTNNRKDDKLGTTVPGNRTWVSRLMNHLQTNPATAGFNLPGLDDKTKNAINAAFNRNVEQFFLNMLPDTSVNKVMVHRNSVPGFSTDMVRAYAFRTQIAGRALANLHASALMSDATETMLQTVKDAQAGTDPKQAQIKANVVSELLKREAQTPMVIQNDYIDTLRAMNHSYFLGLAPAHFLINTTQVGVMLWPELSKRFGFVKSAKMIARVTPQAFAIIRETLKEAQAKGINHIPDAAITPEALVKAGLPKEQAAYVMRAVLSGLVDIGSSSRSQGRIAEGRGDSVMEKTLEWASTTGYYSEMLTRLTAVLAAGELHGNKPGLDNYIDETVNQSMFQFQTWNQARAVGRMGVAGQFTPIMTSLMQYQFQATEKLIRELANAFGMRGATKQEKTESLRFLGAHMAAITVLAGSLGLPGAAIFAALFDKLKDVFYPDDEPSDIQTAYRDWLAYTFGKEAGEVLARGLPRAIPFGAGVDVSQRAGEQNFLPFGHMATRLLTDKRQWKDKVGEWALDTLGAPTSMISSIIGSGNKMLEGKYMDAMVEGLPLALRGPVKAYKMTSEGYTDGSGNTLPMLTPGAGAVLAQALGFNPAAKAEYTEARGVQQTYKGEMQRRARDIRNGLIAALKNNDMETARQLYLEGQRFGAENPRFNPLKGLPGIIKSRQMEAMKARAFNTTLGVPPDLAARTNWANIGN